MRPRDQAGGPCGVLAAAAEGAADLAARGLTPAGEAAALPGDSLAALLSLVWGLSGLW